MHRIRLRRRWRIARASLAVRFPSPVIRCAWRKKATTLCRQRRRGMLPGGKIAAEAAPARATTENSVPAPAADRSEEHTSELQSLMRISYAVFCLKKQNDKLYNIHNNDHKL